MKPRLINPLRYPGSKSSFVEEFSELMKTSNLVGKEIVEPYAGSSSISLGMLHKGLVSHATLIERDPLIYAFWHCVFSKTRELIELIDKLDVTLDTWYSMEKYRHIDNPTQDNILEMGLAGLFFNRTNFSGVLHAGPIGGKTQTSAYPVNCRFNKKDIIKRVLAVSKFADQVHVIFGDAIDFMKAANLEGNSNRFFYIDPPYYKQGSKLYRYHYDLIKHKLLADTLTEASYKWILSYDKHHVIEHFYTEFNQITRDFRYSSRSPKQEQELLITNIDGWATLCNQSKSDMNLPMLNLDGTTLPYSNLLMLEN